jgi:bifunctional non-homologous end joining protein LigD
MATATKRKQLPPRKPPVRVDPKPAGTPEPFPVRIEPMTAQIRAEPFNDPDWISEPKLDGYRSMAHIKDGKVRIWSRGGVDYSGYFPHIVTALEKQPGTRVLDGEIVAFENGRPSFEALQRRVNRRDAALKTDPARCEFFCFDILHLDGMNLRHLPYSERRTVLLGSVEQSECVQIIHADDDGEAMYAAALATGLEGVVSKRKASLYRPGTRSPDWLKIKPSQTAKFLIVGYLKNRTGLASLLVGYWREGELVYAGRVGSGLTMRLCEQLQAALDRLPSGDVLASRPGAIWVEPRIVVEVTYYEMTREGRLRHPVFTRIRGDVDPATVTLIE